jgi:hypothetical protein
MTEQDAVGLVAEAVLNGDATPLEYAVAVSEALSQKFTAEHVWDDELLMRAATDWLEDVWQPSGSPVDGFVSDVRTAFRKYGEITPGQAKGVLNVMMAQHKFAARKQAQLEKAQQAQPVIGHMSFADVKEPGGDAIIQGYRTVVFADGTHLTLRVLPHKDGERMRVAYLYGPDNVGSYKTFAYLRGRKVVWNLFMKEGDEHGHKGRVMEALDVLLAADEEGQLDLGEAYALWSKNCYVCGRLLTDPVSIELGIGPICRGG